MTPTTSPTALCPHCLMLLGRFQAPYPVPASRCPHCRLLIGAGRARASAHGSEHGARAHGAAAGILAAAARRAGGQVVDRHVVSEALVRVAGELDCDLERLRMIDYQVAVDANVLLPCLADITATFGGWKAARTAAVSQRLVEQPRLGR